jgi:hypothetical protein
LRWYPPFFAIKKQQPGVVPQASFPAGNQAQKWPEIPKKQYVK